MSGDLKTDGETWDIESLDLRAPGITQVRLSGRFGATPKGVAFEGPAKVDSGDPRALLAWLTDRVDPQAVAAGSLRLSGDVALGSETIAVDRLKAEVDRMTVLGRFAYSWNGNDRPARLDAALTAPEIDLDRVQALAKAILGDTEFDRPREGTLSLKIDRAVLAGIEAKRADISMRLDANGLGIERLTIADFGGATLGGEGTHRHPVAIAARRADGRPRRARARRRARADRQIRPADGGAASPAGGTGDPGDGCARRFRSIRARPPAAMRRPGSRSTAAPAASGSRCRATPPRRAMPLRSTIWPRLAPPRSNSPDGSMPRTAARWRSWSGSIA